MKILVTGAKGLLGRYICKELSIFHQVTEVDREEGDLKYPSVIWGYLKDHNPDYVLHLAAKVGRIFGEGDLMETISSNAGITANVAFTCGMHRTKLAYASTSEVYGDFGDDWVDEGSLNCDVLPRNLYGLSKRWGEEVSRLYAPDGLIILRFGMPIGLNYEPGYGKAAIATFIWNAMNGKPIVVHRDTERSWCWVEDIAKAVRMIIEIAKKDKKYGCGAWNVGRDDNLYTMEDVARKVCKMVGVSTDLIQVIDPPCDVTHKKKQSTERLRVLGWKPEVDFDEMLKRMYLWMKDR